MSTPPFCPPSEADPGLVSPSSTMTTGTAAAAAAADSSSAGDAPDPLREAQDEDLFMLVLFIEEGTRFGGLSIPPYPSTSVVCAVDFEERIESNPVPLSDRPSFREEVAFRITKAELVDSMAGKEAISIDVYLVNSGNPSSERVRVGSQRIFVDGAKPVRTDLNGSILYKLTKKKLLGGEVRFPNIPCLKTSLVYEAWSPPNEGGGDKSPARKEEEEEQGQAGAAEGVEAHNGGNVANDALGQGQGGRDADPAAVPTRLHPVHDGARGCFVLGDGASADALFKLTIQIIHAKDIDKALPKDFKAPSEASSDFYFRFEIFRQSAIQTAGFSDPSAPEFVAETVAIRVMASFPDLLRFLGPGGEAEPLRVGLACRGMEAEEGNLALTMIPLAMDGATRESLEAGEEAEVEGYAFFPTGQEEEEEEASETERPRIGYAVKLSCLGWEKRGGDAASEGAESEAAALADGESASMPAVASRQGEGEPEWSKHLEREVVELEEWKLKQKQQFNERLREQEKSQDAILTREFREREEEREGVYRAKMEELTALSEELKSKLSVVTRRQQQLERRERAVEEKESGLLKKEEELGTVGNAMSAEGKRRLARLEQEKKEIGRKLTRAEEEAEEAKATAKEAGKERERELKRAEQERRAEEKRIAKHKEEVERAAEERLTEVLRSKDAYKEAWEKAEAELQMLRDEREREKDDRLRAAEDELRTLRTEVEQHRAREQVIKRRGFGVPAASPGAAAAGAGGTPLGLLFPRDRASTAASTPGGGEHEAEAAARMLREMRERRGRLVGTGCYGDADDVVRLLDEEIRKMERQVDGVTGEEEEGSISASKKRKSNDA